MGPGEPGFHEHYWAARAGDQIQTVKPKTATPRSLDALVERYLDHLAAKVERGQASPLTLKGHRSLLTRALEVTDPEGDRMGSLDADMPTAAFLHMRDAFPSGAGHNLVKALRAAYAFGVERDLVASADPVRAVRREHRSGGGAVAWSVDDFRRFVAHHRPGTTARLWLMLSLNVLPRIGDVPGLGWQHLNEGILFYQPEKRGSAPVSVPLLGWTREELERHPGTKGGPFIRTESGKPFRSPEALRNRIQKWTASAKLPKGRTQHGVRKGAAALLVAAGANQYEVMAVMAHTEAKTSEIYTRSAERARLAAAGIARLDSLNLEKVDHDDSSVVHISNKSQ
ncbi:site-specific integrase [Rhodovulum sp. 12E13]|nr:site-specific integrase [Rhodovulum sp. 12E13]